MTTELKNKIDLLIVDLQEYRDGNDNITDFHIAASLIELKDELLKPKTATFYYE